MYQSFDKFVLRLPVGSISDIASVNHNDSVFKNAIYLSSPSLQVDALKDLEYKYWQRYCSRPTPFGLFASISVGNVGNSNQILVEKGIEGILSLDSYCQAQQTAVRHKLYLNNTINSYGDFIKLISPIYHELSEDYEVRTIMNSEVIQEIIRIARDGCYIEDIYNLLDEYNREDVELYIRELIDNTLLIPSKDSFSLHKLELPFPSFSSSSLLLSNEDLHKLDFNRLEPFFEKTKEVKHLFKVDAIRKTKTCTISQSITSSIAKAINFLCSITKVEPSHDIEEFIQVFSRRYDSTEVKLLDALDPEYGIGYPSYLKKAKNEEILEGIKLQGQDNHSQVIHITPWSQLLDKKYYEAIRDGQREILLTKQDTISLNPSNTDPLNPLTVSVLVEVIDSKNISIQAINGLTANTLLGRFNYLHKDIDELMRNISQYEHREDAMVANITYTPESRIGNVLKHKATRKYNIPILKKGQESTPSSQEIELDDLYLRLDSDKLLLYSKKNNLPIYPKLDNAHNFSISHMPIYRFLCDYATLNTKSTLSFSWRVIQEKSYYPRVKYFNCILKPETWIIESDDLKEKNKVSVEKIQGVWEERKIQSQVFYVEGDHKLFLDIENKKSIKAFISAIKGKRKIVIEEFITTETPFVIDDCGNEYRNEVIFSFFKN